MLLPAARADTQAHPVTIGVLALRGAARALEDWGATADLLSERIAGRRFAIRPLSFDEVDGAVGRGEIDFLIANSSIYLTLEVRHGIRPLATMRTRAGGGPGAVFGGVLFTRADRHDINAVRDLQGRRLAAVDPTSFGGWRMAWRLLLESGIDPARDLGGLDFLGTHDAVVLAVKAGRHDAGTVRSGVIEDMIARGAIGSGDLKPIHRHRCLGLDLLTSTPCYPEWPIATLPRTPEALVDRVAVALIGMPQGHPAAVAAGIEGWAVAQDYRPVHDLLRALKLPPYDRAPEVTLAQVLERYWPWLLGMGALLALALAASFHILGLNRRLLEQQERVAQSFADLKATQAELVEAEKMASLGSLVAGVSHEINTPVGMALTGITFLQDRLSALALRYREESMTEEDFSEYLHQCRELQGAIRVNLERAATLVRGFKQIAVDQSSEGCRRFPVREYTEEVLLSINSRLKHSRLRVELDIAPDLAIESWPGDYSRILTNLLLNALTHAYGPDDPGVIRIAVAREDGQVVLTFADDGRGIEPQDLPHIFEPFFTTNRAAGGTGLGLNIVYNLVTQRLRGAIACTSRPGQGTRFTIRFPDFAHAPTA